MASGTSQDLNEFYSDYYSTDALAKKRALTALDSVDHIQALNKGPLGRLLDVGAGDGSVLQEIAHRKLASEICALEISASGIERINQLALPIVKEVKSFDGYAIPYEDASFESAICIHVMEHVEHERMLLREIGRVAKNIYIEVPLEGGVRGRTNYKFGHINYYTPLSVTALLETSGLEVVSSQVFTSSLAYEQYLYGKTGGKLRNMTRNLLLKGLGPRASELMTYLFTAHCRPVDAKHVV